MKNHLMMFVLCVTCFDACYAPQPTCVQQDIKVGDVKLMPSSIEWLLKFNRKTLVFKDSVGIEMKFRGDSLSRFSTNMNLRVNCQVGITTWGTSFDYVAREHVSIGFKADNNRFFNYILGIANTGQPLKDTILYDVAYFEHYFSMNWTEIAPFSKRGNTTKPNLKLLPINVRELADTTIAGKSFQNVYFFPNLIHLPTDWMQEVIWSSQTNGILFFKEQGKSWFFDRIE